MAEMAFAPRRLERTYRQTINAPPEDVFPLLCPVREAEWLDGWSYRMIYSRSGLAEEGAVFATSHPGEAETLWLITRHEQAAGRVEFARFTPDSRTCLLKIAVTPSGARGSHVDIAYAYTTLGPAGDRFLEQWTEEAFLDALRWWERSMNHFLRTGEKLRRP